MEQRHGTYIDMREDIHARDASPAVAQKKRGGWGTVLLAYAIFLLSAGMSIATLFYSGGKQSSAAPILLTVGSSTPHVEFQQGAEPLLSQESFFQSTLEHLIEGKQSFIEADLADMTIVYYRDGVEVFQAKILSKGKEGSWWETPAGFYSIQSMETNHLSSFGGVYQPWSMAFQGNFFIHGWPYYPNGTPVSSKYSGGCIRLADADAEALYDLVDIGTSVLVHERDFLSDEFTYEYTAPAIEAEAYLVADVQNGEILLEEGMDEQEPITGIAKLMTGLVATEYVNLDADITIQEDMLVPTSVPRLTVGTETNVYSLLFPLLLESSNESARALALRIGEETFVAHMNRKAHSLGMEGTHFVDSAGQGAENVSTASDLLRLLTYLKNNRSFLLNVSSGKPVIGAYTERSFGELSNFNVTPNVSGFAGGQVGGYGGKQSLATLYEVSVRGTDRTLAFVVLSATDRNRALASLHEYIMARYGK